MTTTEKLIYLAKITKHFEDKGHLVNVNMLCADLAQILIVLIEGKGGIRNTAERDFLVNINEPAEQEIKMIEDRIKDHGWR